jgi:hypothetical protein
MDNLQLVIDQLRVCREELVIDNAIAQAKQEARHYAELYAAHQALPVPTAGRAALDFQTRREILRRNVERTTQHLNDLEFAPAVTLAAMAARRAACDAAHAAAVVPMGGADEDYPTERELSWQEQMSRDVGVPLYGDRF